MTAKELKFVRESKDIDQAELAAMLDVSLFTVSRWERGLVEIPRAVEIAVAAIYADKFQEFRGVVRQLYIDALAESTNAKKPKGKQD
jgi:transcriptional regulator with XRE-family HTH domain